MHYQYRPRAAQGSSHQRLQGSPANHSRGTDYHCAAHTYTARAGDRRANHGCAASGRGEGCGDGRPANCSTGRAATCGGASAGRAATSVVSEEAPPTIPEELTTTVLPTRTQPEPVTEEPTMVVQPVAVEKDVEMAGQPTAAPAEQPPAEEPQPPHLALNQSPSHQWFLGPDQRALKPQHHLGAALLLRMPPLLRMLPLLRMPPLVRMLPVVRMPPCPLFTVPSPGSLGKRWGVECQHSS